MHTPGPWKLTLARMREGDPIFGFTITAEGKIPYLASAGVAEPHHALIVSKEFREMVTTGFSEEEVEANARLISASPELLSVLERLVLYFNTTPGPLPRDLWQDASAVIDKAKGDSCQRNGLKKLPTSSACVWLKNLHQRIRTNSP